MKLIRTTLFSGIVTFVKIASGFVAGKVIATLTGPSGVALIGIFTNFITISMTFANGAINTGVIKYTAEFNNDEGKLKSLFSTAFVISILCSSLIGLILLFAAPFFASIISISDIFINPIRVLGLTLVLYSLNNLFLSILNGKGKIKAYTIANTTGSFVGLILTVLLVYLYNIQGALYALVLSQSLVFLVTLGLMVRGSWFSFSYFTHGFKKNIAIKLSHFSLMAIITALIVPISQILVRNILINQIGIEAAGFWQGMLRVSDGYLLLITTSLSTYYLPKLSTIKDNNKLRNEIFQGYKIILPFLLVGCIVIYYLRFFIINTLYSNDFVEMESLFFWQLIGDFFKIPAWLLAYLMIAKAMVKVCIITELIFNLTYVVMSYQLVTLLGIEGVTIAFAINNFFYLLTMIFIFKNLLFKKNNTIKIWKHQ